MSKAVTGKEKISNKVRAAIVIRFLRIGTKPSRIH